MRRLSRDMMALTLASLGAAAAAQAQRGTVEGTVTVPSARITGVVVYLVPDSAPAAPAVEPADAGMDQRDLRFLPRVVVVTPGSTVVFSNTDQVRHNVFHPMQHNDGFDLGTWPPGESRRYTFKAQGAYVILCNVHPEMVGYVVVVATPYRAVTDDEGRFRIEGVAPGSYRLRTWHRWLATREERITVLADGVVRLTLALKYGDAGEPSAGR
ncbi:MAG: carboxypeptidase regulatory-like domain-containing protein [Gemmatimonadetes bacterium]|nr:carboxypeptidase regulatory-like domain-containing protein [Gemmatimonadota bacterium]